MRIPGLDIQRKKAVVILGAGASRGATCFQNSLLPAPLDADFFSLVERVQHRDKALKRMLEFVKGEFGEVSLPRMEELFTQIEALSEFHEHLSIAAGPRIKKYKQQLDDFVGNIARFFRHVFVDPKTEQHRTCDYHDRLAELLHAEDSIVTFNYDCLIDTALRRKAGSSWNAGEGYGVPLAPNATEAWEPKKSRGRPAKVPISLLKLHGSLNWDRSRGTEPELLLLRENPYAHAGRTSAEVVPPVWDKAIKRDPVLTPIWKKARRILSTGPVLLVIGYSVPPTDLLSQALIRVAASERAGNQKLTYLIVVNPDIEARRRFIRLVQGGMDSSTTVIEMSKLDELHQLLG